MLLLYGLLDFIPTWELVNKMKISIRLSHDQQFTSFNVQKKFRRNSFALLWLYSRYFKIMDVSSMVYQWTVELQLTLHVSIRMYMYIVCLKESVMHVFWWWMISQGRSHFLRSLRLRDLRSERVSKDKNWLASGGTGKDSMLWMNRSKLTTCMILVFVTIVTVNCLTFGCPF